MENKKCFCDTGLLFENCCGLYLQNNQKAPTALALMRSRYSAYASHNAAYLLETTYVSERKYYSKAEILKWAVSNKWQKLEILSSSENTVEFKAYFLDSNQKPQTHYEFSTFKFENEVWFYLDGKFE
ncbi:YchJ family protein [Flavobacterium reichenbachii]|uniref:Preprotein translocase subunit SecA n=1 Tax=Flavobacterium reichenbachii TaxID=362418 RepID=A0A085ZFU5_9FLAO|nr:YchJ family metal-binding protein [Flavobacterium reichenbachii]KFF03309.1 preprotein translocase subunit SecA [Flavobacterium reichenbachii]OXB15281.1 preprotein translocase subunit SecA [Flavobacterium reichenbachii]